MSTRDLYREIRAIQERWGLLDFHRRGEALREAKIIWGLAPDDLGVNEHGVFLNAEKVTLASAGWRYARASIAKAGTVWAVSPDWQTQTAGHAALPSVWWSRFAYHSREAAVAAGASTILCEFDELEASKQGAMSKAELATLRQLRGQLRAYKDVSAPIGAASPVQLALW